MALIFNLQSNSYFQGLSLKLDKRSHGGIAGASAIDGLPEIHMSGKSMVSAAASTYRGENTIAVGYFRLSDNW